MYIPKCICICVLIFAQFAQVSCRADQQLYQLHKTTGLCRETRLIFSSDCSLFMMMVWLIPFILQIRCNLISWISSRAAHAFMLCTIYTVHMFLVCTWCAFVHDLSMCSWRVHVFLVCKCVHRVYNVHVSMMWPCVHSVYMCSDCVHAFMVCTYWKSQWKILFRCE